jgi:hypothetical protein
MLCTVNRGREQGQAVVQLVMQVHRRGEQYRGTVTRPGDQCTVPFSGLLELIAVLERLTTADPEPAEPAQ